ncbi:MAG: DEAD/DEAH box helicase, partial [Rhodoglobus sp.]
VPAIQEWGAALLAARPDWPLDAVVDVLRRTPPRTISGALATAEDGIVDALVASLLDLDSSYLAVQGPPGTGKTYTGAHVIARLVADHGWRIGVVSQSHTTVENLLAAVLDAGLRPGLVGKKPKAGSENEPTAWMSIADPAAFLAKGGGRVLGGTAWTFSNREQVPRRSLDLLVIDEAGQFSLASTIAASMSARRLLLLGDPQQLPQVSQGTHPEPVDGSALGFVSDGHEVLPAELGYFLPESRRMDAALAAPVSALSYEGRLRSHPVTRQRLLEGVAPGLHPRPVVHEGDATSSPVEAAAVVELVESLLGTPWTDPGAGRTGDPLGETDFIVVTPYNAQVVLVREALDAAGHQGVRVGTVDRFQGQEAVVAIVTLAASSAVEVPRGLPFLILKNRLNVAISRAQWAAYLIYSPELADFLPPTPAGVAQLSAFIDLTS